MPTYEYECPKCGIVFEHFQSITAPPLATCIHPEGCKHPSSKAKVSRLLGTGAGIIFKGSGFYTTDYRSKEYKDSAKKDRDAGTSPSSTASSSSDSSSTTTKSEAPPSSSSKKKE